MHTQKAKTKQKPAQLNELYLSLAREQIEDESRAITETKIKEKVVAPKSRQSGSDKPAAGVHMAKQVKNLSAADFKILVQAVHARLGIDDVHEDENENPIEAMIRAATGNGAPLLRKADAPLFNLVETKKPRRK